GRVGVVCSVRRRIEPEPARVDPIAGGQIIRYRITLVDEAHQGLIRANPLRMQGRNLHRRQHGNAVRQRISTDVRWTVRLAIRIRQTAMPKMIQGNRAQIRDTLRVTTSFIIEEEEQVVFLNRSAQASAELITGQLGSRNTFAGILFNCSVIEKCVSRGQRGSIVFAKITVKYVAAALGYHLNLTAVAAAFGGGGIRRNGSEFLNRIDRSIADCNRKLSGGLVIRVNSINGDVPLVGPRSSNGADAIDVCGSYIVSDNSWLQANKRGRRISKLYRKFL